MAQKLYLRLMLFIGCYDLYLILTHEVVYEIYLLQLNIPYTVRKLFGNSFLD